ncbi:MAG: hypothetical protein RLZZ393_1665 [Pseudomonadota bacterium]|jgi:uncharacterized protein (DUF934 family)
MAEIIKNGALLDSAWTNGTVEQLAAGAQVVLPLADYLAFRAGSPAAEALARAAVQLQPADDVLQLAPLAASLPLVVVVFPEFKEGRGYTQARLLRDRLGFKGELRAIGQIRADLVNHLARCGFDAFELADGENADVALAELKRFSVAYQPDAAGAGAAGAGPLRRRYGA